MLRTRQGRVLPAEVSAIALVAAVVTLTFLAHSARPEAAIILTAAGHLGLAAAVWAVHGLVPTVVLIRLWLPMLLLLGGSTWVSSGHAAAVGPLYVLVFAWMGLRCPNRDLALAVPVAAVTYAGGLYVVDAPAHVITSVLVLLPVAVAVYLLIATRAREQRRLRAELEARDQWRAALMATLAHDVRSPLTNVAGVLEILEDDPVVTDRYDRLLQGASRQTTRIMRLATGLLDVERVSHGRLVLDLAPRPVAPIAEQVAALSDPERVRVAVDPGVVAHVDGNRLEQVLYNLVTNALRHGEPPVVIGATAEPGGTKLTVEDHGGGVPEDDVLRLFDRFTSSDRSSQSVGLGLWIVHTLVDAHGGTVRYEAAAHGGARFVIRVPGGPATSAFATY